MDPSLIPKPPSGEHELAGYVIWVLLVGLVIVVGFLVRMAIRWKNENDAKHAKCEENHATAWSKVEERDKTILSLHQGVIADSEKTKAECASAFNRVAGAIDGLKDVIRDKVGTSALERKDDRR